ncbi:MAG: glutamine--fructose-6-phosphate transaminase (isomerizing) [Clostridia bacterium]
MCGIVGYIGYRSATDVIMEGLKRLEYRGYDSAGLALVPKDGGPIWVLKREGDIASGLSAGLEENPPPDSSAGIGHTRWATHGRPNDINAHPHTDCRDELAVVHNGIIENYFELGNQLREEGHRFKSNVDTEVIPHLVERQRDKEMDLLEATMEATHYLKGAYALAVMEAGRDGEPEVLVGVRRESPLIVGVGDGEHFLASDIAALLPYTRDVVILENGDFALLTREGFEIFDESGQPVSRETERVEWDADAAERGGHPHFMIKEILEQPSAWIAALQGRVGEGAANLPELERSSAFVADISKVYLVGCGTSYHAALAARSQFERFLGVPARAEIGSEFRYAEPLIDENTLVVFVSQSGETADTLACLDIARAAKATTIGVTNVVGSSLSRGVDDVVFTRAGPEISVASTKTYTTQLLILDLIACHLGTLRGLDEVLKVEVDSILEAAPDLPGLGENLLSDQKDVIRVAEYLAEWEDVFYIGRGLDYAAAMEGQLKLKEISYIHAEAYAAGELKHGTIALIEDDVPVIAICTQDHLRDKVISNVESVRARGGWICLVTDRPDEGSLGIADEVIILPRTAEALSPVLVGLSLQLLAYHAAVMRGCPVDKPRNLAKSVTVE